MDIQPNGIHDIDAKGHRDLRILALTRWAKDIGGSPSALGLERLVQIGEGVRLAHFVEVLSERNLGKHMYRRRSASSVVERDVIEYILKFLEDDGLVLCIDSDAITSGQKETLALDLLWPLLVHYRMPANHGGPNTGTSFTLQWLRDRLQVQRQTVNNLIDDWRDGKLLGALINSFNNELCADWETWDSQNAVNNLTRALAVAARLGVIPYLTPADITNPGLDEISMTVYLHQFMNTCPQETIACD